MLFKYLAFRRLGKNHVEASRFILLERFSEDEFKTTTGNAERTWWFNMVTLFAALSQAIKLFGMRGIIATQLIGMAYLVSYAAIEVLLLSVGPDWPGDLKPVPSDIERYDERLRIWTERLQIMAIQLQRMAWTWVVLDLWSNNVVEAALGLGVSPPLRKLSQRTLHIAIVAGASLCLGICIILFMSCFLSLKSSRCASLFALDNKRNGEDVESRRIQENFYEKRQLPLKILLFNLATHGAHAAMLNTHSTTWSDFYTSIELARLMIAWYVLIIAALLLFPVFKAIARIDSVKRKFSCVGSIREWGNVHFAFSNVVICVVYYAILYDVKGTRKPSWTDNLG